MKKTTRGIWTISATLLLAATVAALLSFCVTACARRDVVVLPSDHRVLFIPEKHPVKCALCHQDIRACDKAILDRGYLKEIFDGCGR